MIFIFGWLILNSLNGPTIFTNQTFGSISKTNFTLFVNSPRTFMRGNIFLKYNREQTFDFLFSSIFMHFHALYINLPSLAEFYKYLNASRAGAKTDKRQKRKSFVRHTNQTKNKKKMKTYIMDDEIRRIKSATLSLKIALRLVFFLRFIK